VELRVFAAASLTEAFGEIASAFEKVHPGDTVELNFAGSQILRTQIEQGARAEVFASADLEHAEALARSGLIGPLAVFARNVVVVVVPGDGRTVHGLGDLGRPGVKVMVAGSSVPLGRYTNAVIGRLGTSGLYGDGYADRVRANVVSEETNARAVLSKVVLGEADAGFVYRTDAVTARDKVRTIDIPAGSNVVAEYALGVLRHARSAEKGRAFAAFVRGTEGQAVLRKYGFTR
jgi:molybdate transport system substrate-binding protein